MLKPGEVVNERYVVEARLGQGGLAEVFRVRHRELNSVHALKLLVWRRQSLIERILLEGRIQAQIRHPNVVMVTDVIRHDGRCGLLMEYIDGPTLEHYLHERGALPVDEALSLIAPIIAAITAAHDAGVLHRDLKPANVLLAQRSGGLFPKVADFGIAKLVEDMEQGVTAIGSMMGSPGYLAPEQVIDSASADRRADIYALGVLLYEVLSGERAFPTVVDAVSARKALNRTPPLLSEYAPEVPDYLCEAIQKAMASERDARFEDCRSLARALFVEHPDLLAIVDRQHLSSGFSLELLQPSSAPVADGQTILPLDDSSVSQDFLTQDHIPNRTETGLKVLVVAPLLLALILVGVVVGGGGFWFLSSQSTTPEVPVSVTTEPAPSAVSSPATDAEAPTAAADAPQPGAGLETPAEATGSQVPAEAVESPAPTEAVESPAPTEDASAEDAAVDVPSEETDAVADEAETAAPAAPAEEGAEASPAPADPIGDPIAAAPVDEPDSDVPDIDLSGQWSGTADQRPLQLRITDSGESIRAEFTFLLGNTQRTVVTTGSFDDASGVFQVTSSADGMVFTGRLAGNTLTGTYQRGRRGKALSWAASR